MTQAEPQESEPRPAYRELLVVFIASGAAVFGLLFQQMWTHSRGFDFYAFQYWGPRAFGVVVVTTILGLSVANRSWKARTMFGVITGLAISFLYVSVT